MVLPKFFFTISTFPSTLELPRLPAPGITAAAGTRSVELFHQNVENVDFSKNGFTQNPFSWNRVFSILVPKNSPRWGLSDGIQIYKMMKWSVVGVVCLSVLVAKHLNTGM